MTQFISKDNSNLLWDILNENPLFLKFSKNKEDLIMKVLQDDMKSFYDRNQQINDLMELNKRFISYITNALLEKNNKSKSVTFEDSFKKKEEEYHEAFKPQLPPQVNFSDDQLEEKISNIDELITNVMQTRQFDSQQIEHQNDAFKNEKEEEIKVKKEIEIQKNSINSMDNRLLRLEEKIDNLTKLVSQLIEVKINNKITNEKLDFN